MKELLSGRKDFIIASPDKGGCEKANWYSKNFNIENYALFFKGKTCSRRDK
jgi:phosphoribosylpyrophosphate synthetase